MSVEDYIPTEIAEEETTTDTQPPSLSNQEMFQIGEIIEGGIPLPKILNNVETYQTDKDIRLEDIVKEAKNIDKEEEIIRTIKNEGKYENKDLIITTEDTFLESKNIKFDKKEIFLLDGLSCKIPIPDLSYTNKEEKYPYQYIRDENGKKQRRTYTDTYGNTIKANGEPIYVYASKDLEYIQKISNSKADLKIVKKMLEAYIKDPTQISYDKHSIWKHGFDSITAIQLLIGDPHTSSPYYKFENRIFDNNKKVVSNYIISTQKWLIIPAESEPEQLLHTEIAKEIANTLKRQLNKEILQINTNKNIGFYEQEKLKNKTFQKLNNNLTVWIDNFSNKDPILSTIMRSEIKYLLRNDYKLTYGPTLYTDEQIDKVLEEDEKTKPNPIIQSIKAIFQKQKTDDYLYFKPDPNTDLKDMLSFEHKVDQLITYLENQKIDKALIDTLRLSGRFNRIVKPVVVLGTKNDYPTTSITTAYLKEYNNPTFIHNFGKKDLTKDEIAQTAETTRKILETLKTGEEQASSNVDTDIEIILSNPQIDINNISKSIEEDINYGITSNTDLYKIMKGIINQQILNKETDITNRKKYKLIKTILQQTNEVVDTNTDISDEILDKLYKDITNDILSTIPSEAEEENILIESLDSIKSKIYQLKDIRSKIAKVTDLQKQIDFKKRLADVRDETRDIHILEGELCDSLPLQLSNSLGIEQEKLINFIKIAK